MRAPRTPAHPGTRGPAQWSTRTLRVQHPSRTDERSGRRREGLQGPGHAGSWVDSQRLSKSCRVGSRFAPGMVPDCGTDMPELLQLTHESGGYAAEPNVSGVG